MKGAAAAQVLVGKGLAVQALQLDVADAESIDGARRWLAAEHGPLTRMLAAGLRGAGVLVNAVCPGWVATDMGGWGGRPVAEGAAGVVRAATLPDVGPSGEFFRDGKPLPW